MKTIKISYYFYVKHERLIKFFCKVFGWHLQNQDDYFRELEKLNKTYKNKINGTEIEKVI